MKPSIKTSYHDTLYYAVSTLTIGEAFHINHTEEALLRKLIYYSATNELINWSTAQISAHTFIKPGNVDKSIQRLKQKGYITCTNKQISSTQRSRTITINWDYIEGIKINNETTTQTEMTKLESQDPEAVKFFDEIVENEIKENGKYQVIFEKMIKEELPSEVVVDEPTNEDKIECNMIEFFIDDYFEENPINNKNVITIIKKQANNYFDSGITETKLIQLIELHLTKNNLVEVCER